MQEIDQVQLNKVIDGLQNFVTSGCLTTEQRDESVAMIEQISTLLVEQVL